VSTTPIHLPDTAYKYIPLPTEELYVRLLMLVGFPTSSSSLEDVGMKKATVGTIALHSLEVNGILSVRKLNIRKYINGSIRDFKRGKKWSQVMCSMRL
jgi:hypothetical protein